jgi:hypothetical protein
MTFFGSEVDAQRSPVMALFRCAGRNISVSGARNRRNQDGNHLNEQASEYRPAYGGKYITHLRNTMFPSFVPDYKYHFVSILFSCTPSQSCPGHIQYFQLRRKAHRRFLPNSKEAYTCKISTKAQRCATMHSASSYSSVIMVGNSAPAGIT